MQNTELHRKAFLKLLSESRVFYENEEEAETYEEKSFREARMRVDYARKCLNFSFTNNWESLKNTYSALFEKRRQIRTIVMVSDMSPERQMRELISDVDKFRRLCHIEIKSLEYEISAHKDHMSIVEEKMRETGTADVKYFKLASNTYYEFKVLAEKNAEIRSDLNSKVVSLAYFFDETKFIPGVYPSRDEFAMPSLLDMEIPKKRSSAKPKPATEDPFDILRRIVEEDEDSDPIPVLGPLARSAETTSLAAGGAGASASAGGAEITSQSLALRNLETYLEEAKVLKDAYSRESMMSAVRILNGGNYTTADLIRVENELHLVNREIFTTQNVGEATPPGLKLTALQLEMKLKDIRHILKDRDEIIENKKRYLNASIYVDLLEELISTLRYQISPRITADDELILRVKIAEAELYPEVETLRDYSI